MMLAIYILGQIATMFVFVSKRHLTEHDYFTILIWPLWWVICAACYVGELLIKVRGK